MPDSKLMLYDLISRSINKVEYELMELSKDQNTPWILNSGLVKRTEGMLGFVSCFPHGKQTEDSLDGLLMISENANSIKILVEVSWSNGKHVADVGQVTLFFDIYESQLSAWKNIEIKLSKIMSRTLLGSGL